MSGDAGAFPKYEVNTLITPDHNTNIDENDEKPHLLTPSRLDCAVLSFLLTLPETKLLSHVRWLPQTCSYNRLSRMWRTDCSTRQKHHKSGLSMFLFHTVQTPPDAVITHGLQACGTKPGGWLHVGRCRSISRVQGEYTDYTRSQHHPEVQLWVGASWNWSVFLKGLNTRFHENAPVCCTFSLLAEFHGAPRT